MPPSQPVTIYVPLLDENVDVSRPVLAEHLRDRVYRILPQPYDRESETWAFEPGDVVICRPRRSDDWVPALVVEARLLDFE